MIDAYLTKLREEIEIARATCSHELTGLLRAELLYLRFINKDNK